MSIPRTASFAVHKRHMLHLQHAHKAAQYQRTERCTDRGRPDHIYKQSVGRKDGERGGSSMKVSRRYDAKINQNSGPVVPGTHPYSALMVGLSEGHREKSRTTQIRGAVSLSAGRRTSWKREWGRPTERDDLHLAYALSNRGGSRS